MKDNELRKLYTLEAFLDYGDLPNTFREGWSPNYGLHFEEIGINNDERAHVYISLNGRLKKAKCEFIQDKALAEKLLKHVEVKLKKLYPSITLNFRTVESRELDYRRKKALDEATNNNLKIQQSLQ
ncbi:hypothetical protein ABTP92_14750 [Acinetobacter baumannii]|uniref:hypothetical protein n=1 Tax=Acinetobacter baumannii TaxID=470 RepID=UPI0002CDEF80|nr:hypothetical protein [Acinetobacter baumannii]ENU77718.1 hypothetical protein F976_01051 [Acinetobacter baumannii NIPH 1734]MBD0456538.1 hypothetical protein [Acinetobacter baumannii]MBR8588753.1 hypothetical protein [Acinetobacter baumannii]MCO9045241.1 hypothetical protein [Acinetobacter baumannii]MCO9052576.1 hypothetical protein [Acinetobacter baumannii]